MCYFLTNLSSLLKSKLSLNFLIWIFLRILCWAKERGAKRESRANRSGDEGRKEMALWGSLWRNLNGLNGDIAEKEKEKRTWHSHGTRVVLFQAMDPYPGSDFQPFLGSDPFFLIGSKWQYFGTHWYVRIGWAAENREKFGSRRFEFDQQLFIFHVRFLFSL